MCNVCSTQNSGMPSQMSEVMENLEQLGITPEDLARAADILGDGGSNAGGFNQSSDGGSSSDPISTILEMFELLASLLSGAKDPSSSVDQGTMAAQTGALPPPLLAA